MSSSPRGKTALFLHCVSPGWDGGPQSKWKAILFLENRPCFRVLPGQLPYSHAHAICALRIWPRLPSRRLIGSHIFIWFPRCLMPISYPSGKLWFASRPLSTLCPPLLPTPSHASGREDRSKGQGSGVRGKKRMVSFSYLGCSPSLLSLALRVGIRCGVWHF